jgi:potassium/chloride transporter 9
MFASNAEPSRPSIDRSTPSHDRRVRDSIYARPSAATSAPAPAPGFPFQASIPLSFNDLPCRAQHLILNELMVAQSRETAVVFTTLPSPVEGTWRDQAASASYVSDLEAFWQGLPPCLLVHSNSMTVTMNL